MNNQLENLRAAHNVLADRVLRTIRTQVGDQQRIDASMNEVLQLAQAGEQHHNVFSPEEYAALQRNVEDMLVALDVARQDSIDPPGASEITILSRHYTGQRGRPPILIDPTFLANALDLRGPTHLAPVMGISARTIRRAALRFGLVQPGQPMFMEEKNEDGEVVNTVHTSSSTPVSTLTNAQLDGILRSILEIFPAFGRSMLHGSLREMGHRVPHDRITQSYVRLHGSPGVFGPRRIERRQYRVPGPLSLVHHDGQHGLIRYGIVIHCFIDGFSRFVLTIRASDNNRAQTVLDLFLEGVVDVHGVPSRVRGDHGTENILVAHWMDENRGSGRGSYIWGRSVHNTRIERLWYDVTQGFGRKWKNFFIDLETNHGLDPQRLAHRWLLHTLFAPAINEDAQDWANAWNSHSLTIAGERRRSPRDMWFFGMIQEGLRGQEAFVMEDPVDENLPEAEISEYGVDWEVHNDPALFTHLLENNEEDWEAANPFATPSTPANLSEVVCNAPDCPLSMEELDRMFTDLQATGIDLNSRNMHIRRLVWQGALNVCQRVIGDQM